MKHRRVTIVFAGLLVVGALIGAICAVIAVQVALITATDGAPGLEIIPVPLLGDSAAIGALIGAILTPLFGFVVLRQVPLGRAALFAAAGTILGAVVGEVVAPLNPYDPDLTPGPIRGALLGFVAGAVIVRLIHRAEYHVESVQASSTMTMESSMSAPAPDQQRGIAYPSKDDVEWVAVDRHGRVGIFTTGGEGSIPRAYLRSPAVLEQVRDAVWTLSERSDAVLLSRVPRPDDFLAFARRGCFAFDWADVDRVSGHSSRYALQARPVTPLAFAASEWPEALRPILECARSNSLDFDQRTVDVSVLDCASLPAQQARSPDDTL